MRIIKHGRDKDSQIYRGECARCKTEVEFTRAEATEDMLHARRVLRVNCPVCHNIIWSDEISGRVLEPADVLP